MRTPQHTLPSGDGHRPPSEYRSGSGVRGRAWAWGIAGAYGLFAALTLGMVGFAYSRSVNLVSPDYYQRELQHQSHIDAVRRTQALGAHWRVQRRGDRLWFHLRPGLFQGPVEGRIHFYRPDDARLDRYVDIALDADGSQQVSADLAPGLWRLRIAWRAEGQDYFSERELRM